MMSYISDKAAQAGLRGCWLATAGCCSIAGCGRRLRRCACMESAARPAPQPTPPRPNPPRPQVESLAADIAAGTAEGTPQSRPVFSMLGGLGGGKGGRSPGALAALGGSPSKAASRLKRLGVNISEVRRGPWVAARWRPWQPRVCVGVGGCLLGGGWEAATCPHTSRPSTTPPQAAKQLDLPMLQQLQPLVGASVASLEREACDANTSRGKKASAGLTRRGCVV